MKKTLLQLSILALVLGGQSCKNGSDIGPGIPVVSQISFDILAGNGPESWFALPGSTSADSVLIESNSPAGGTALLPPTKLVARGHTIFTKAEGGLPNVNLVQWNTSAGQLSVSTQYIQLNRRDVDTLRVEVLTQNPPNYAVIERITVYYNNRISAVYDFRANPSWNDSLTHNPRPTGLLVPLHKK